MLSAEPRKRARVRPSGRRRSEAATLARGAETGLLVTRVGARLAVLGNYPHLCVRSSGVHILIARVGGEPVARLSALGADSFGLSFPDGEGRWEPILVVDALEEVVATMAAALEPSC